jgi:hypothetical protein
MPDADQDEEEQQYRSPLSQADRAEIIRRILENGEWWLLDNLSDSDRENIENEIGRRPGYR